MNIIFKRTVQFWIWYEVNVTEEHERCDYVVQRHVAQVIDRMHPLTNKIPNVISVYHGPGKCSYALLVDHVVSNVATPAKNARCLNEADKFFNIVVGQIER